MCDPIVAEILAVENCNEDCPCQHVHIELKHADGELFARGSFGPDVARAIARDLEVAADVADARRARMAGRVA